MSVYFLLEDSRSFSDLLPCWMSILKPEYRRVSELNRVDSKNCYILKSGCGYPRLLGIDPTTPAKNILGATLDDICRFDNIDTLVMVFDADDESVYKRRKQAIRAIRRYRRPMNFDFRVFIINHCFETWLLGNRAMYPKNASIDFKPYHEYYNVSQDDPERMKGVEGYLTTSMFHFEYLRKMLRENRVLYSKRHVGSVCNRAYLQQLQQRVYNTNELNEPEGHLKSLRLFMDFIDTL